MTSQSWALISLGSNHVPLAPAPSLPLPCPSVLHPMRVHFLSPSTPIYCARRAGTPSRTGPSKARGLPQCRQLRARLGAGGRRQGAGGMLNSRTSVQASPLQSLHCPRREATAPRALRFLLYPHQFFSSLLSEFGAHQARLFRVSFLGIFSLSKSPCCLEVPSRPGLERRAWLRLGRGLACRGGAGSPAWAPGREAAASGGRDAAGTSVGVQRSPGGGGAAGRRYGACGLHGASGVCLSSGGRIRPQLLAMGDILSTHLDDARRQHIAGEDHSSLGRPGAPPCIPGHASDRAGRGRGSLGVKAQVGSRPDPALPPNLFPLGLDGPSRPFCTPFPL